MPEISFKEMLMVPDGPPASVWERALDAAYAAAEEDAAPEEPSPDSTESDAPDTDFLATAGDADGPDTATLHHHDSWAAPGWDEGLGSGSGDDTNNFGDTQGEDQPDYGEDAGDTLPGGGDGAGY